MKWFLLTVFISVILLVLLFSFGRDLGSSSASPAPAVQPTVTATGVPTNGPLPTVDTLSPRIYSDFNVAIESMETSEQFNELEHIAGASYQVIGVDLPQENNPVFRVKTRCECAENGPCCNYIHTFVVTITVLGKIYNNDSFKLLQTQTPGNMSILQVWCYDHSSLTKRLSVPWTDVISFFNNTMDGFQLWSKVTVEP